MNISSKMSRMTNMLKSVQQELKSRKPKISEDPRESPVAPLNVSSIEKASFFQEDQDNAHGPLHSTALDDDFSPDIGQVKEAPDRKGATQARGGNVGKVAVETPKRPTQAGKGLTEGKGAPPVQQKRSTQKENQQPTPPRRQSTRTKARPLQTISAGREGVKTAAGPSVSQATSSLDQRPEADHSHAASESSEEEAPARHQHRPSLSAEELTDEEPSYHPGKKKSRAFPGARQRKRRPSSGDRRSTQRQKRKSSSGSSGPRHSTALDDDSSPGIGQGKEALARKEATQARGGNVGEGAVETPKRPTQAGKGLTEGKGAPPVQQKRSTQKENQQPTPPSRQSTRTKARPLQTISAGREGVQRAAGPSVSQATSSLDQSPEADDSHAASESSEEEAPARRQRRPSLSAEELTDEEPSYHPGKRKSTAFPGARQRKQQPSSGDRRSTQRQKRKSSSGSSESSRPAQKQKQSVRDVKNPIDLDLVLHSFQDFVSEYKETVDSDAVKQAIDALSRSFEHQLTEKITATKELNNLKSKNTKINSAINRKRARLVDAKNELIKNEALMRKLQKDHAQLEQRLSDLRRGSAFLSDLGSLHQRYLDHREAHPEEVEVYGPSSMPALLLEARCLLGVEHQLKTVNEKLHQALGQAGHE